MPNDLFPHALVLYILADKNPLTTLHIQQTNRQRSKSSRPKMVSQNCVALHFPRDWMFARKDLVLLLSLSLKLLMWISKADNSHLAFREMYTSNTPYYVFGILDLSANVLLYHGIAQEKTQISICSEWFCSFFSITNYQNDVKQTESVAREDWPHSLF